MITNITVQDLKEKLSGQPFIIDVRSPEEHEKGHIDTAQNFPIGDLPKNLDTLREHDTIYVHCQMGGRSKRASDYLTKEGLNAINIEGGWDAWTKLS
jgi:rhodanese-related sulfurtransferase